MPKPLLTTDPQDERFDLVDENDQVIGTVTRGEANRNPALIHRAAAVLVFNTKGQLFLQKRSRTKDTYPGYWTISASGHVKSERTYHQAALEELKEELGIEKPQKLKRLRKEMIRYPHETEFETFYRTTYDGKIILNSLEIERGTWFTLDHRFFKTTLKKMQRTPELEFVVKNFLSRK